MSQCAPLGASNDEFTASVEEIMCSVICVKLVYNMHFNVEWRQGGYTNVTRFTKHLLIKHYIAL